MKAVEIRDGNLAKLRLDARIFSDSHAVSKKWNKDFREHPDKPQGQLYNSRRLQNCLLTQALEACLKP